MADAVPSGPNHEVKPKTKKPAAKYGIVRNQRGHLVKRDEVPTPSGPVVREVRVFEDDYKEGDVE